MSQKKYPGFQYMTSFDAADTILRRHEEILAFRGAAPEECVIKNMKPLNRGDFKCDFELHWTTGKGWQCYMQHTGIYTLNPDEMDQPCLTS